MFALYTNRVHDQVHTLTEQIVSAVEILRIHLQLWMVITFKLYAPASGWMEVASLVTRERYCCSGFVCKNS